MNQTPNLWQKIMLSSKFVHVRVWWKSEWQIEHDLFHTAFRLSLKCNLSLIQTMLLSYWSHSRQAKTSISNCRVRSAFGFVRAGREICAVTNPLWRYICYTGECLHRNKGKRKRHSNRSNLCWCNDEAYRVYSYPFVSTVSLKSHLSHPIQPIDRGLMVLF